MGYEEIGETQIGDLKKDDRFIRKGSHGTWLSPWRVVDREPGRVVVEKEKSGARNALPDTTIVTRVKVINDDS